MCFGRVCIDEERNVTALFQQNQQDMNGRSMTYEIRLPRRSDKMLVESVLALIQNSCCG